MPDPDRTAVEVPARAVLEVGNEAGAHLRHQVVRDHPERQGQDVQRLPVADPRHRVDTGLRVEVPLVVDLARVCGGRLEPRGVAVTELTKDRRRVLQRGHGHDRADRGHPLRGDHVAGREPVAPGPPPPRAPVELTHDLVGEPAHERRGLREERTVAVLAVQVPRDQDGRGGPCGVRGPAPSRRRDDLGHRAVGTLRVDVVVHPLAERGPQVEVVQQTLGRQVGVRSPAVLLVDRRVGRDAVEVVAERAGGRGVDPLDQRLVGAQLAPRVSSGV